MISAKPRQLICSCCLLLLLQAGCTMKLQPMINSFSLTSNKNTEDSTNTEKKAGVVKLASTARMQAAKGNSEQTAGEARQVGHELAVSVKDDQGTAADASGHTIISRRAMVTIHYAEDLAKRGAVFSAEAEFIQALKLIAHAYDAQAEKTMHLPALLSGWNALKEADDFAQQGLPVAIETDLFRLVATHKTPVLKEETLSEITPLEALQRYYAYAEHELAFAGGTDPAASKAFYGLARLQSMYPKESKKQHGTGPAKSIALHRTALRIDKQNYMAANELGVLLARAGHFENAKECLMQSLSVSPQLETWKNLARVCEELGNKELAETAWKTYGQALHEAKTKGSTPHMPIQWVDFEEFNEANTNSFQSFTAQPNNPATNAQSTTAQSEQKESARTPQKSKSGISSIIDFAKSKVERISFGRQTQD